MKGRPFRWPGGESSVVPTLARLPNPSRALESMGPHVPDVPDVPVGGSETPVSNLQNRGSPGQPWCVPLRVSRKEGELGNLGAGHDGCMSMYVELLSIALARDDRGQMNVDDVHASVVTCRSRLLASRMRGDRSAERELATEVDYDRSLINLCRALGIPADSTRFAQPAPERARVTIDSLRQDNHGVGFVVARPPGHHATADRAMGFCLLNNIAVAAASLTAHGDRVLIVDWDVHHGNGTQSIFWDDPNVLYVSTHQWPLYPGTGKAAEIGGSAARGLTVNIPVPSGATGDVIRMALN
jgi:Histone deacetylase domain